MKRTILSILILLATFGLVSQILPVLAQGAAGGLRQRLKNGDVNGDGTRDISDAVRLLNFFFQGGAEPVEIEAEGPSPEALAKLQAAAIDVVASLPTEEQVNAMPPQLAQQMKSIRRRWTAAANDAPSWSLAEYSRFLGFVEATNDSWSFVAERLSKVYVGLIDQECLDACDLQRLLCENWFEDIFGDGSCDYDCETGCDVELAVCKMRCPLWIRLPTH